MKISVVVKRDNKWYIGWIDGKQFHTTTNIKKLSDVKDLSEYITLKKYLKDKKLEANLEQELLKAFNFQSIYVLKKPINPSAEEFESYWWEETNIKCKLCIYACKQSSKVIVEACPNFKEKVDKEQK